MYSINSFAISRLNNAEYLGFFTNMQKELTSLTYAGLGLDASLDTAMNAGIQTLTDQVYQSSTARLTLVMNNADQKRINIYKRILLRLQMVNYAEENAELINCKEDVQLIILSKYTNKATTCAMQERTGIIEGFIYDLQQRLDGEVLSTLGIADDVDNLVAANKAFVTAYNERANWKASLGTAATQAVRAELLELYKRIGFIIQYHANDSAGNESTASVIANCQKCVDVLNVLLAEAKTTLYKRLGTSTATEDASEDADAADTSSADSGSADSGSSTSGSSTSCSSTSGSQQNNDNGQYSDDDDDDVVHL